MTQACNTATHANISPWLKIFRYEKLPNYFTLRGRWLSYFNVSLYRNLHEVVLIVFISSLLVSAISSQEQ